MLSAFALPVSPVGTHPACDDSEFCGLSQLNSGEFKPLTIQHAEPLGVQELVAQPSLEAPHGRSAWNGRAGGADVYQRDHLLLGRSPHPSIPPRLELWSTVRTHPCGRPRYDRAENAQHPAHRRTIDFFRITAFSISSPRLRSAAGSHLPFAAAAAPRLTPVCHARVASRRPRRADPVLPALLRVFTAI